jgi:nicotinate-nucleotide--dimethylbenzimidazole phosphoribosyltransferase
MPDTAFPRPIPLIGDPTSAGSRATDPTGWAFDPATIDALDQVLVSRRDIRRFRPDPVPHDLLIKVLNAGHQAPSVGHSQPWRFIVVQEPATRDDAARMADRERHRQAALLSPDRRERLLDLKLDGIRDAPLGIVVACDRRAPADGVLGRSTFPDTDLWSCAAAIENIWLTARAHGLGLGWVTLFRPADLAELLHLPRGVETLGWLCLGWPDERPPDPGLERHGWSSRLALSDVVLAERWPAHAPPEPPPSHLAGPNQRAVVAGRDTGDELLAVPGSLGVLDTYIDRALALNRDLSEVGTLVIAAAHHPVTAYDVSAYPASVTADVMAATVAGTSLGAVAANSAGLTVVGVQAGVAHPGDLVTSDAMTIADVERLITEGRSLGARHASKGLVCLGEVGIGNTTVAAALACALLGIEPQDAVGLGAAADSEMVMRKIDVVTRSLARAREEHGDRLADPVVALAALGGPEIALLAGVTLGAAEHRAPVILDGLVTSIAALVATRMEPAVQSALVAGQQSREVAHEAVLVELGIEPLLRLRLRSGEGVGACLGAQLLLTGLRARRQTARVTHGSGGRALG